jgi:hypothetical protein
MTSRIVSGIYILIHQTFLVVLAVHALRAGNTFTFQNGANGYSGAQDVSINTQYAQYNGGNGATFKGAPELDCFTITGDGGYTAKYLLKFTGLTVPAGSTVVSASLAISLDSWNEGPGNITGFYIQNTWDSTSSKLGWLHRDATHDWAAAGASGNGTDLIAGKSFQVPALKPVGPQTVTIPLDASVVQSWIDSAGANQGIILVNNNPDEVIRPVSTVGTKAMRPKLIIVTTGGTGTPPVQVTVSPSSATLKSGAQQPFTATVTGSSNTAVAWTATGGTISSAGVFTAGSTAGSFSVTATSVADSSKSATANVVIQPPVQVTISPGSVTLKPGQMQPFTATVTGSSNTAVTWTATGGTISSAGVFTAGSTAGSFSVTATSVADSTKAGSAQVTITASQPPPPPTIQVTVSPAAVSLQPGKTQQFSATVTGSSNTAVTWMATGGSISSSGLYTAGQNVGSFSVTATAAADNTKTGTAGVSILNSNLPPIPREDDGPYVVIDTPASGMHFTAPATIRIYADPVDPTAPDPDAQTVTFLVNGQPVGSFTGSDARNGYYTFTVSNLAAGTYTIAGQIHPSGGSVKTSPPVTVFVDNPSVSSGPVFNLSSDVVLTGSQNATYTGTPSNHCLINGNGHQIRSASGFTGSLNISYCDVHNLGTDQNPSINVTVNGAGSIQLIGNVWEMFGTVAIGANDTAQATIRGNEFRANTLVPVLSLPTEYFNETLPVISLTGNSSAQQFFQGNNVGLSTVVFSSTRNWLIGGDTDADSNILIGVRCGFTISQSSNMVLRGNYSQHNYPSRFSQGDNFQLDGDGFLVEHNIIRSSSWPVRGMGGELRYNIIDSSANSDQVIQGPLSNANMHHNIILQTVTQGFYGPGTGLRVMYNVDNVQFNNNVMDGGGKVMEFFGSPVTVLSGAFVGSLRNNVFYNFTSGLNAPVLSGDFGESTNPPLLRLRYADYNDFYNPDAPNQTNYGLGVVGKSPGTPGYGMHDLGGFNGHANPMFANPTALPFPFAPEDIWSRTKKVSDVLAMYRAMYTPTPGSPLIGAGDPQDGVGGNIGAIGNGEAADQFGKFGGGSSTPPTPPAPTAPAITSFTALPTSIQPGQSSTLSWSVSGAASLSIAPGPGTVTGTSVSVTPSTTTTYTLTATNSVGSSTATARVTVTAAPAVAITLSPNPATLFPNGTQQFTAMVTNASNMAVTWSATGGTISAAGLYTAGSTTGSFSVTATSVQDSSKSASAPVNIVARSTSARPRIILDAPTLATLRSRMQVQTHEWTALKSVCDSFIGGGTVNFPGGDGYPNPPSVGEGYQGDGYVAAVLPLGLCYQTMLPSDPVTASKYGSKGVAVLMAMSDPAHQVIDGTPIADRDDGYGIRNYGFAMGIGYDWFHDLMAPAQLSQLQTALNGWITGFENDAPDNFEYAHPQGNYFAGYYASKCMAALAVQGDSPLGDTWWNDWYNNQHLGRVAPYYRVNLAGGGWTEGYAQYGILATRNQSLPALAVKTAKGIDLIQAGNAQSSYTYPLDNPRWLMAFTWPTRDLIDDRGELYNTGDPKIWPGTGSLDTYRFSAGILEMLGDPMAPMMHKYASDAKTALNALGVGDTTEWIDFLFWDPTAPEASDYSSLPLSYLAPGMGGVTARSDWSTSATFMSFMSGPYINNPGAGHEAFDKGSLAIERNKNPLVVNADAWLSHEPNGDNGWTVTYDDRYGNWSADHNIGNRILYNTFQVRQLDGSGNLVAPYGQAARQRTDDVRTEISRFEDGGSYVLTVGQFLEDMYYPFHNPATGQSTICGNANSAVTSLSREIVYLRPSQFVVYDRSGICDASLDQYLAFHFQANPVEVAAPAPGLHRFDVNSGQFAGSMSIVLPANAAITTTSQFASDTTTWNKLWRTEIRATDAATATRRWMTVFDLAPTSGQIATATPLNVTGAAVGVLLQSSSGNNVVIAGTAPEGTAISGAISYVVPATQTHHVITDLTPSTGYTVSINVAGTNQTVTITPSGSSKSTANGVLTFQVNSGGQVTQ